MEHYPVTVVDNFYPNPDEVRNIALGMDYVGEQDQRFPGVRTVPLHISEPSIFEYSSQKLFSIFHDFSTENVSWNVLSGFQSITEEYNEGYIHHDNEATIIAAVIYLTPNADLESGTSIFTPNKNYDKELYDELNKSKIKYFNGEIDYQTYSVHRNKIDSMFDETMRVNNVYNRMVMYEGNMWHKANKFFGNSLESSRLTQIMFAEKINCQKQSPLKRK
jgi:hypothetical protein